MSDKCPDVMAFMDEHKMDCQMARKRITIGVPITTEHGGGHNATNEGRAIAEASTQFVTTKDLIFLSRDSGASVDDLIPQLRALLNSINKITRLPETFNKSELTHWLTKLNGMGATDTLGEAELREMGLVMDKCQQDFDNALDGMR
eukprot:TRINITY_DN3838_c0_g1_i10.p1 TRINITY_DN3838_c0_g1~~TRINITY_DN3838_c0_g1_i10.p1  ORF type:complete len:146 (-),score=37.67 TRINITY_DN3838_c0_g1_i10:139-576(-)